jgi:DNA-binding YbaB/EbfC family protein
MRDLMGIMKQAQQLQQKLLDAQAELDLVEVEGTAGGGLVKMVMTAKGQVKSVTLDRSLLNPDEKEIVEDLLVAAANDARGKAERTAQERMAELTKGLPLPPGLKLF